MPLSEGRCAVLYILRLMSQRGLKIGDVDPRDVREHCFSITDKALAVAGGVMEAISLSI